MGFWCLGILGTPTKKPACISCNIFVKDNHKNCFCYSEAQCYMPLSFLPCPVLSDQKLLCTLTNGHRRYVVTTAQWVGINSNGALLFL